MDCGEERVFLAVGKSRPERGDMNNNNSKHIPSIHCVPCIILSTLHVLTHIDAVPILQLSEKTK